MSLIDSFWAFGDKFLRNGIRTFGFLVILFIVKWMRMYYQSKLEEKDE